jgi:ACS family hexuronate transporter-like MFS transporter
MSVAPPDVRLHRHRHWKWWVCGLLLLATMINYMDRVALNLMAVPIMEAFRLDSRQYGQLESAFSTAFALGAIVVGWLSDRMSVRWLYPLAVLAWSLAGFATGLANSFFVLLVCRFLLGFAESGNWPCALQTTKHILEPRERTMGNSILQSGAAFGAMLTPPVALFLMDWASKAHWEGPWRLPFLFIGLAGMSWAILWLLIVRAGHLASPRPGRSSMLGVFLWLTSLYAVDIAVHYWFPEAEWQGVRLPLVVKALMTALGISGVVLWLARETRGEEGVERGAFYRRFAVLAVIVVVINLTWHFFRAWMPLFLQKQHNYTQEQTGWFVLAYYVSTDVGSLTAGGLTLALAAYGLRVHTSRFVVFGCAAVLTTLSVAAALLPTGWLLLGVLLVIGFACLGMFPVYYALSQDITLRHQGKVTGALGCITWLMTALMQEVVGDSVKSSGSYSQAMSVAGLLPLLGLTALWLGWERRGARTGETTPVALDAMNGATAAAVNPGSDAIQRETGRSSEDFQESSEAVQRERGTSSEAFREPSES